MPVHEDLLFEVDKNVSLETKLKIIHRIIRMKYPFIHRISVALYDPKSDMLRTFLSSSGRDYPLEFYEARMEDAPSLQNVLKTGKPRVINDLSLLEKGEHEHTKSIIGQGYRASYTTAMYSHDRFSGFVFFNSYENDCLEEAVLADLDVYGHLIAALIDQEMAYIRAMLFALKEKAAEAIPKEQRTERALRLARISRFARLIALELAKSGKYELSDAEVEEISWFSPFHLLSKVQSETLRFPNGLASGVQPQLNEAEVVSDPQWIDRALQDLGFESSDEFETLKNIARYYHENVNGSGYPEGLKRDEIPIEARIVCVADLFDAMTGQGVGMQAWSNDEAFAMLKRLSKTIVDEDCVEALVKNAEKVEQVQASFMEAGRWIS